MAAPTTVSASVVCDSIAPGRVLMKVASAAPASGLAKPERIALAAPKDGRSVALWLTDSEQRAVVRVPALAHAAAIYEGLAVRPDDVEVLQARVRSFIQREPFKQRAEAVRRDLHLQMLDPSGRPPEPVTPPRGRRGTAVDLDDLVALVTASELAGFPLDASGIGAVVTATGRKVGAPIDNKTLARAYARLIDLVHLPEVDERRWDDAIAANAARLGLDPAWVKATAAAESRLVPGMVSGVGAIGLMQMLPSTYLAMVREELKEARAPELRGRLRKLEGVLAVLADSKAEAVLTVPEREMKASFESILRIGDYGDRQRALLRWLRDPQNPVAIAFDGELNLRCGVRYLSHVRDDMRTSLGAEGDQLDRLASAAYNAGPGRVKRLGRVPMIRETTTYVDRIALLQRYYSSRDARTGTTKR